MHYEKSASRSPNSPTRHIAIMGGTFDPIHYGHLALAKAIVDKTPCTQVQFLPCHLPVHRGPTQATAEQRRDMIALAIKPYPAFSLNDMELRENKPSYTIDTLKKLTEPVYFCLGIDAFSTLSTWREWEHLLDYCHLLVVNRPGYTLKEGTPECELFQRETRKRRIISITMPPSPISATLIRQKIQQKESIRSLLPQKVSAYIQKKQLYGTLPK